LWDDPPLHLYALAQVRASEVKQQTGKHCDGCPGPGVAGGCETRPFRKVCLGRHDWPMCPRGMTRDPMWERIVERYVAAQVSPLADYPDDYTPLGVRGLVAIKVAVREEDDRRMREQTKRPGGPQWTGRTSAREV
jgi:hypothetical protein